MSIGDDQSNKQNTTTTTTNIDKRVVADNGGFAVSGDTVNVLDGGAINSAFEFAKSVDMTNGKNIETVLGLAGNVFNHTSDVLDHANSKIAQAYDSAKGEATQKNIIVAVALVAVSVVAMRAFK